MSLSASSGRRLCPIISTCIPESSRPAPFQDGSGRAGCGQMGNPGQHHRADTSLVRQRRYPIVAAAAFHESGHAGRGGNWRSVRAALSAARTGYRIGPVCIALLASGLNSTVTATLAGQIVMEGFLHLRLPGWACPAHHARHRNCSVVAVTALYGESGTARLLVFSQVILSMQLPFAVIPFVGLLRPAEDGGLCHIRPRRSAILDRRCPHPRSQLQTAVRHADRLKLEPGTCRQRCSRDADLLFSVEFAI